MVDGEHAVVRVVVGEEIEV
jgi:hypothetical protein